MVIGLRVGNAKTHRYPIEKWGLWQFYANTAEIGCDSEAQFVQANTQRLTLQ